jgi:hypothetical protein
VINSPEGIPHMNVMKTAAFALAATAVAATGAALAQNYNLNPAYGSVELYAGFTPDPFVANVVAGGPVNVGGNISGCAGWVADAPDFRLFYGAGGYPLTIGAFAQYDSTIVVNAPDGGWYCDDDSGGNLNPAVFFTRPTTGQYDIWVGTYQQGVTFPAQVVISEQ